MPRAKTPPPSGNPRKSPLRVATIQAPVFQGAAALQDFQNTPAQQRVMMITEFCQWLRTRLLPALPLVGTRR